MSACGARVPATLPERPSPCHGLRHAPVAQLVRASGFEPESPACRAGGPFHGPDERHRERRQLLDTGRAFSPLRFGIMQPGCFHLTLVLRRRFFCHNECSPLQRLGLRGGWPRRRGVRDELRLLCCFQTRAQAEDRVPDALRAQLAPARRGPPEANARDEMRDKEPPLGELPRTWHHVWDGVLMKFAAMRP